MRTYLVEANEDLLYQIEVVQELLGSAKVGEVDQTHPQSSRLAETPSAHGASPRQGNV